MIQFLLPALLAVAARAGQNNSSLRQDISPAMRIVVLKFVVTMLSLAMMVEGTAQSFVVLKMEPFERPLELKRLCTEVTEIWCRAVYTDPDRLLTPEAAKVSAVATGSKRSGWRHDA